MVSRRPKGLYIVAIVQFFVLLILPPTTVASMSLVLWIVGITVFALLGISMIRLHSWAGVATIFIQGMNIIIRLLVLVGHATIGAEPGAGLDVWMAVTTLASIICSWYILRYVDQPEIQAIMQ